MANPLDSLSSGLIGIIGEYFAGVRPSAHGSTDDLGGDRQAGLIVVYSSSGMPMGIGTMRNRVQVARVAAGVPGARIRTVDVGDEALAANLAQLIGDLFGGSLPFGIIGPERQASAVNGAAAAPKRRGRKPGSKNKSTGRKRGRPARASVAAGAEMTEEIAAPRRRGRRPKSLLAELAAPTEKRRPGRPRKNPLVGETPARRPGRPRKNPLVGETPARRPGRPRKNPVAAETPARRPGRPRKNPVAGEAPKRRGRPPGKRAATPQG